MITKPHRGQHSIRWLLLALLALMACLPIVAAAQGPLWPAPAPEIHLRAGSFAPARGEALTLAAQPAQTTSHTAAGIVGQWLVQYGGPVLPAWREALEGTGAIILGYVPDYAYQVLAADAQALARLPGVIWVGPFYAQYRLSPELSRNERQPVRITFERAPEAHQLDQITRLGLTVLGQDGVTALVEANTAEQQSLSALPGVQWMAPLRLPRLHNDIAAGQLALPAAWSAGLLGAGQTINVADTGLDTGRDYPQVTGDIHADLEGRVARISSWPIAPLWYPYLNNPTGQDGAADRDFGHGTHVAGSAVGNGARSNGRYRGVAPQAQLTFQALEQYCDWNTAMEQQGYPDGYYLVGLPADLRQLYAEAYGWGSRISSNSWGLQDEGVYTPEAQQTDQFVWDHRDMAILFAVGNQGRDANGDGRVDQGSVMAPATAKNIIAVGGTESLRPEQIATYGQWFRDAFPANPLRDDRMADAGINGLVAAGGRGPTQDGRLAPHVVAPGTWIASLRSSVATNTQVPWGMIDSHYMYMGGTSMSTPLVAGVVALTRQAYMQRGHTPSAALLKATLIQTARDIPGQYAAPYNQAGAIPNNHEGWGAVDAAAAVAGGRWFLDETVSLNTGQVHVYAFDGRASTRPVRVTLVWTDYPALPAAAKQLVNDLDLEITAPDGQVYRGNVLSNSWSATGGSADRLNNVECIYLPASQAGGYQVRVRGHNVPMSSQNYALLVDIPEPLIHAVRLPLVLRQRPTATPTPSRTATPTITHTPTRTPSPSATPTLAPGEWRDDFAVVGNWIVATTQDYVMEYVDGTYRVGVSPTRGRVGSLPAYEHPGDVLLEVKARAANSASQAYGLLFNYDDSGPGIVYRAFLVTADGRYMVIRQDGSRIVDLTHSGVINTGQAYNLLAVRRAGQTVQFRVNGTQVLTLQDAEFTGGAGFGVVSMALGDAFTDARFDDYRLVPVSGGLPSGLDARASAGAGAPASGEGRPARLAD